MLGLPNCGLVLLKSRQRQFISRLQIYCCPVSRYLDWRSMKLRLSIRLRKRLHTSSPGRSPQNVRTHTHFISPPHTHAHADHHRIKRTAHTTQTDTITNHTDTHKLIPNAEHSTDTFSFSSVETSSSPGHSCDACNAHPMLD